MAGTSAGGRRRLWIVAGALGFGVTIAAILAVATFGYEKVKALRSARLAKQAHGAAQARGPRPVAMVVAPAPLPTALPLVARAGEDAYGYPRSYVDGPALRSLLEHDRFANLTSYVEQLQREFEADPKKELWPIVASGAFASSAPELLPKLDAWVAASPSSFAPYLARGTHWTSVAYARRGAKWARDTPPGNFKSMREAAVPARADLERALSLSPRLVAALRQLIDLAIPISDDKLRNSSMLQAERVCPTCFSIRVVYMNGLKPRWGGSFRDMEDFAARAPVSLNARLKLLPGYVDLERADIALADKKLDDALRFANAACARGQHWDFLGERAEVLMEKNDYEHAVGDLDLALEQRPELARLHLWRARAKAELREWEAAGRDLVDSMRLDASGDWPRYLLPRIVGGLSMDGFAAHQAGERDKAIRLLELASQLSPFDREVHRRREEAVRGKVSGTPDEIAGLEARAKAAPDDFGAYQQLDFALAKSRNYPRVIELWSEYLTRHPQDGPAFFERSGAYHNSGHKVEALADLAKACDLGVDQACAYQRSLKH